ncbi:uncharacterized protein LOC106174281 [Lingula anatina]|uniref:Uncharacterized protein LOC106174281 n=1 Tax=Lingula anatina TaxID=7574 RepID=A0A1S3JMR3_LINAN|nr:uncharacterized protein LOC106174281 [Lingula anatina]|eukprot:XP_013411229.1 uncharacterized protein LOC106174281 [Lingula anatina]
MGTKWREGVGAVPSDLGFCLNRLFDPLNYDHTTVEEFLKGYKERDLKKAKLYKIASNMFGVPPGARKRRILAPPMEKAPVVNRKIESAPELSLPEKTKTKDKGTKDSEEAEIEYAMPELAKYKKWFKERKEFRITLESMGLNEEWLVNKPDKTPLEYRMLQRFIDARTPKPPSPEPVIEVNLEGELPENLPLVHRPAPLAIKAIDEFLHKKNMRLIDLFRKVDKDKNWKISTQEFRKIIKENHIPISDILLEDLMLALDTDLNDELDYKELAMGLDQYKIERRESQKKMGSIDKISTISSTTVTKSKVSGPRGGAPDGAPESVKGVQIGGSEGGRGIQGAGEGSIKEAAESTQPEITVSSHKTPQPPSPPTKTGTASSMSNPSASARPKSELSTISQSRSPSPTSSLHLEPPEADLRPEQMILSSEEAMLDLRKRDREALARMMGKKLPKTPSFKQHRQTTGKAALIKTGNKAIDDHCRPSTLEGETADMVDRFRQLKVKEYHEILRVCQKNHVPLAESLLERVLFHPPDKPHSLLKKKIRQPGVDLLVSSHYADPPKKPKTPMQIKHKDKMILSKTGQLLIDSRHMYPQHEKVAPAGHKINLSTGRAVVRRRVDCWMSFEEYDRLTSKFAVRYKQLHGNIDDNAFWPGHLLDKIRLCMPPYDNPQHEPGARSMFRNTTTGELRTNHGYDNDLNLWPVNDSGCIQMGMYDPYKNKPLWNV